MAKYGRHDTTNKKRNTHKSEDRVKVKHVNWFELKVDHKITKNIN